MIDDHFDDLAAVTCTRRATQLLGRPRATHYRRRQLPVLGPPSPRPTPVNALSEPERQAILAVLRSAQYCDLASYNQNLWIGHPFEGAAYLPR